MARHGLIFRARGTWCTFGSPQLLRRTNGKSAREEVRDKDEDERPGQGDHSDGAVAYSGTVGVCIKFNTHLASVHGTDHGVRHGRREKEKGYEYRSFQLVLY